MEHHRAKKRDGFSLIELLVVIAVLGILATVVVMALKGAREDAHEGACPSERRIITTAAQAYFTQKNVTVLPQANTTPDGYEQTLVDVNLLKSTSGWYDLNDSGELVQVAGSPCTV